MEDDLAPFSKQRFERIKEKAEAKGYEVITTWRPGVKHIRFAPIVLSERLEKTSEDARS